MRPVLIGGAVGVVLSGAVSGVLSSMMFGLGARDPIAFICVPLFLLVVASVAVLIPARRAIGPWAKRCLKHYLLTELPKRGLS